MKILDRNKIEPGDIVLSGNPEKLSGIIRFCTRSDVSHAMICVEKGSLIDSTIEGVLAWNMQRIYYGNVDDVYVLRLAAGLTSDQARLVTNYVRAQVGARYSINEAIQAGLKSNILKTNKQFCSRLVAQSYLQIGINIAKNAEFCTPAELKQCGELRRVHDCFIHADEEEQSIDNLLDTTQVMRDVTSKLLLKIRFRYPKVESINDINDLLISNLHEDKFIAKCFQDSGYLDAWRIELVKNFWQYVPDLFEHDLSSIEVKAAYCKEVVETFDESVYRYEVNLAAYNNLLLHYPTTTFNLLKELYETLLQNMKTRKKVAEDWLKKQNFP